MNYHNYCAIYDGDEYPISEGVYLFMLDIGKRLDDANEKIDHLTTENEELRTDAKNERLEKAANELCSEYKTNKELTAFTSLDGQSVIELPVVHEPTEYDQVKAIMEMSAHELRKKYRRTDHGKWDLRDTIIWIEFNDLWSRSFDATTEDGFILYSKQWCKSICKHALELADRG